MPPKTRAVALCYCCVFLILLALVCSTHAQSKGRELIFKENLQHFGYTFQEEPGVVSIGVDLAFLSDNVLLISVRESPVRTPLSTMLLFSVKDQKLVTSKDLPVRKRNHAIVAIQGHRFLMLSDRGWQICTIELVCGEAWPTAWPIFVSPGGSRATIGGPKEQRWVELNPKYSSLQESWENATVSTQTMAQGIAIAGESGWLLSKRNTTFVQLPGKQEVDLGLRGDVRFVNRARVMGIKEGKATVVALDGAVDYQVPGKLNARTAFMTCFSGSRFGIFELGYRGIWIDFGDENGAYNLARMRIFDVASGRELFDLKWNPGHNFSWDVTPVMSSDGHRVAMIVKGELRVYEIP